MALNAETDASKQSIVTEFNTVVTNVANAGVAYNLSNNPFTNSGLAAYANPYLSNTPAPALATTNISDADIVATGLNAVLRNYALNATRIRNVLYNYDNFGSPLALGQGITIMNASYVHDDGGIMSGTPQADAGEDVEGAALTAFIAGLANSYNVARNLTVTLTACHSACHSSCHGARGRR